MTVDEAWIHARFDDLIVPRIFARARSSTDPLWIGIGGQPGAGKTHGRDRALRLNGGVPVTAIIGDDLRAFHPDYQRLIHEDPLAMPAVTAAASARWVELALEHARENRYNVLVEGTFRRPEVTLGTAARFHDVGYRTHLVAIAVAPWESQLSSIERFQLDHEAGLTARWTDPAAHDAGVRGTPITLDAAAASPRSTGSPSSPVMVLPSSTRRAPPRSPARPMSSAAFTRLRRRSQSTASGSFGAATSSPTCAASSLTRRRPRPPIARSRRRPRSSPAC